MAKHSEKYYEARETLPDEMKPIFDEFVSDYKYAATQRHGAPYVSYIVLADMVRAAWRPSGEPYKIIVQPPQADPSVTHPPK